MTPKRVLSRRARATLAAIVLLSSAPYAHDVERLTRLAAQKFGQGGVSRVQAWRAALAGAANLPETERLQRINTFFNNSIRFADDSEIWQQPDYWATPLETLGKAAGDCEDFALAKYYALIEIGVSAEKLRLVYVRARVGAAGSSVTQAHMVLTWYASPQAEPLVLDNLVSEIRPASRRPDLVPVFSFNSQGLWMAGADKPASSVDRLTRWNDLQLRMRAEGFEP
jgi:predicted transglutaminase-like cysteine proteinase